jgi:hypothetical protein
MSFYNEMKLFEKYNFNLGAALITPVWCIFHGKPIVGALLAIALIAPDALHLQPPVSTIIHVLLSIISLYFGFKGNAIAMDSGRFRDREEMLFVQGRWAVWGTIVFIGYMYFSHIFHAIFAGFNILSIGMNEVTR